jgi:ribokinase
MVSNPGQVAVVGSANVDVVVTLQRFPLPGETVIGDGLEEVGGGKGANQAMAAARGARTAFIGCIGRDGAGDLLVRGLDRAGVRTDHVMRCGEPTGRAFIQVTPDGENSIVVMALANGSLSADTAVAALQELAPAVVLCQLEIPLGTVQAAARWTQEHGAAFVLNPSPLRPLSRSLLERCDPLIVNAAEADAVLRSVGRSVDRVQEDIGALAAAVAELAQSVVVTAGDRGAFVGTAADGIVHIAGKPVTAVDTTGAGDEFAGQVAAGLARGLDLRRSAELANEAAARLVQIPRRDR